MLNRLVRAPPTRVALLSAGGTVCTRDTCLRRGPGRSRTPGSYAVVGALGRHAAAARHDAAATSRAGRARDTGVPRLSQPASSRRNSRSGWREQGRASAFTVARRTLPVPPIARALSHLPLRERDPTRVRRPQRKRTLQRSGRLLTRDADGPRWSTRLAPRRSNIKYEIAADEPFTPIRQDVKNGQLRYGSAGPSTGAGFERNAVSHAPAPARRWV